jgi:hypothetical protein
MYKDASQIAIKIMTKKLSLSTLDNAPPDASLGSLPEDLCDRLLRSLPLLDAFALGRTHGDWQRRVRDMYGAPLRRSPAELALPTPPPAAQLQRSTAAPALSGQDRSGMTPLMWAAWRGDKRQVDRLLEAGAAAEQRDVAGLSCVDWARLGQNTGLSRALARHTGLSLTTLPDLPEVVTLGHLPLLRLRAAAQNEDVNARLPQGETLALLAATLPEPIEALRILQQRGANLQGADAEKLAERLKQHALRPQVALAELKRLQRAAG